MCVCDCLCEENCIFYHVCNMWAMIESVFSFPICFICLDNQYVRVTGLYKSGCFLSNLVFVCVFFVRFHSSSATLVVLETVVLENVPERLAFRLYSNWRPGEKNESKASFFKYFVYTTS
jgi:hypothetical protein